MIKQNPFSLYDFLGYFIPGALLIYLIIFFLNFDASNYDYTINQFIVNENNIKFQNLLFFTIASYALGHLVNFSSSILVERYANWIYDYPSKYLLNISKEFKFSTISIKRCAIWLFILPVSLFDLLLGHFFKFKNLYTKKLDSFLIDCITQKGLKLLNRLYPIEGTDNKPSEINEYDFFRIFHHYAFEHTKNHQSKMINYVVLYGFLRSLTFILVIIFWVLMYEIFIKHNCFIKYYHIIIISGMSYVFFMAFMKFYRRYTLETFMIIAISEEIKES